MYDQHERNLEQFQSIMSKRHPRFLQPFNVAIRGKEESTAELVSLEKQLLDTTIDLYQFAERNPESLSYQHGNLVSHDADVWKTFAEKRRRCVGIYQRLRPLMPRWLSA
jgi:hypothetical protein